MIRKLSLTGFKSHEDTKLEFSDGTNVFVGIMGSGKSSILQGITFALFGDVPEVRNRKLSLSGLVMRKPRKLEEAKIDIEFDVGDIIYKVERGITQKGGTAKMFKEGKVFEVGAKRVTQKVCEIMSTDYDSFVNVVYARQNEIDNFLRYGKTERVKLIDGLLKIDRLEDARKKLRSFSTGVKSRLNDLLNLANRDMSEHKEMCEDANNEIDKLKGELSDLQAIISSSKDNLNSEKLKFERLDELRKKRDELVSRVSKLEGEEEALSVRLSKLPNISKAIEKFSGESERFIRLKTKERELTLSIAAQSGKKQQLEKRIKELENYAKQAKETVKDLRPDLDKLLDYLSKLKADCDSHIRAIEQLNVADAKCPTCDSVLSNPKEHISRHTLKIKKLKFEIETTEKKFEMLKENVRQNEKLQLEVESAKLLVKNLPELKNQLSLIDIHLQKKEFEKIKKEREEQEKLVNELRLAVERQESEVRLKQILSLKESLKIKMSDLGFNEKKYADFRKKLEMLSGEYNYNMARMRVIPNLIGAKQVEIMSLQKNILEVEKAQKEKEKTEKGLDNLSLLINSISDIQIIVRQQFIEIVNELLSEIWTQLYPYGDYASLRIFVESDGRRAGDYILQLRESKDWVTVEGVASGGEKSIASLALRVAFSRALSKLGLLLLDEPTHNLDDNGIENLTEVLREGMPNVLDQVVIITHEERMEKSATGFAYKLFRDKVKEESTKIERL